MACALAELGWHSTLLDRATDLAQGASGNPAGLFHGVVHAQDGAHARFGRAAAFEAHSAIRQAIESHAALGATDGLSFQQVAAKMTGMTQEEYAGMMLKGGRSVEGNRSKSEWTK